MSKPEQTAVTLYDVTATWCRNFQGAADTGTAVLALASRSTIAVVPVSFDIVEG